MGYLMCAIFFIVDLGECMKLSLVNCDGGQKDDSHRPDAMVTNLPNTTSSKLYQSNFLCYKAEYRT